MQCPACKEFRRNLFLEIEKVSENIVDEVSSVGSDTLIIILIGQSLLGMSFFDMEPGRRISGNTLITCIWNLEFRHIYANCG